MVETILLAEEVVEQAQTTTCDLNVPHAFAMAIARKRAHFIWLVMVEAYLLTETVIRQTHLLAAVLASHVTQALDGPLVAAMAVTRISTNVVLVRAVVKASLAPKAFIPEAKHGAIADLRRGR